jgi:hypothetical protein
VSAGLAKSPGEWPFSSYLDYIGQRKGSLPKSEMILSGFYSPDDYRSFVEVNLPEFEEINHLVMEI